MIQQGLEKGATNLSPHPRRIQCHIITLDTLKVSCSFFPSTMILNLVSLTARSHDRACAWRFSVAAGAVAVAGWLALGGNNVAVGRSAGSRTERCIRRRKRLPTVRLQSRAIGFGHHGEERKFRNHPLSNLCQLPKPLPVLLLLHTRLACTQCEHAQSRGRLPPARRCRRRNSTCGTWSRLLRINVQIAGGQ